MLAKFRQTTSYSANRQDSISARVSGLFLSRSPAAVVFEVTERIVHSLKRHPFRSVTHVSQKVLKRSPLFADRNATRSIAPKLIRVFTAVIHITPRLVRRAFGVMASMAVNKMNGTRCFFGEAPAGTRVSTDEVSIFGDHRVSARAQADARSTAYSGGRCFVRRLGKHLQSSKSFPDEIFSSRHGVGLSGCNVVFSGDELALTNRRCDSALESQTTQD